MLYTSIHIFVRSLFCGLMFYETDSINKLTVMCRQSIKIKYLYFGKVICGLAVVALNIAVPVS